MSKGIKCSKAYWEMEQGITDQPCFFVYNGECWKDDGIPCPMPNMPTLATSGNPKKDNAMNQEEHNLQCACVKWFAYQHPELQGLLFAVPNGGARSKATAGKLKAEGVVPGVADLILLVPQWFTTWRGQEGCLYAGLCIEMKTPKGRQSPEQKGWQEMVEAHGYKYAVCHSLDEFINTINDYLK